MNFTWEAFVLIIAGVILLRISGRKINRTNDLNSNRCHDFHRTIIVQPIIENSLFKTLIGAAIFTLTLILMEWLQIRFNLIEKMLTGKAKIVIETDIFVSKI